jgi:HD-like signal output (HDOD) protein
MFLFLIVMTCLVSCAAWLVARRAGAAAASPRVEVAGEREVDLAGPEVGAGGEGAAERDDNVAGPTGDLWRVEVASELAAQRLWRLAFAVTASSAPPDPEDRDRILAVLTAENFDASSLPRRPSLMPQLLQAVNDPASASDRIARIITHDPVLTADVLRLANSNLYRTSDVDIETIQRAIVVCGVDALRGMLASALLRPVFRATRGNFPRFPRLLWERTEAAARAAELYALKIEVPERFEAQLLVLLRSLGPLAVYGAALDVYRRNGGAAPCAALCAELVGSMGPKMSQRIARDWQMSPRLLEILEGGSCQPLAWTLHMGELLGTAAFLETHAVLTREQRDDLLAQAGVPVGWAWPAV